MQLPTLNETESAKMGVGKASHEMPWIIPDWSQMRSDVKIENNQEDVFETGQRPTQMFQNKWLIENGIGFVYGANREGFLYVRFVGDDELYARMRFTLDTLVQPYKNMLQNWEAVVTEETLAPEEDDQIDQRLRERNMAKMFVVLLHDKKTRISEKLYRVQVRSADPRTQKVKVYCVDEHMEQEVNESELIPLDNLHPDLAYVAPLICKVHLYGIKLLRTKNEIVHNILTGEILKMSLVHEWPKNAHHPEVSIDVFPSKLTDDESLDQVVSLNEQIQLTGLSKYFVQKGCAKMMDSEEMKIWNEKNMKME